MGLFAFLKSKFSKKEETETTKRYEEGLKKSRKAFASRLDALAKRYEKVDNAYFEELEEILIENDVGVELTLRLIDELMDQSQKENLVDPKAINDSLVDKMFVDYVEKGEGIHNEITFLEKGPTVILVEGVNGVGKTTTIAKLAYRYIKEGKKILLVAGDTFRAGAREQLTIWAKRLNCPIVTGKDGSDPASVCYEGAEYALSHPIDLMIVDTAGRLQNKQNLMDELAKMKRVLSRAIPGAPHETFLVIDATTGQNGVSQARAFQEVNTITGIVITKMDGTSKGGIILSIRDSFGIPVRFIGLGEKMEDLEEFDLEEYLNGLLLAKENDA